MPRRLHSLLACPAGRRSKYVVLAVALALVGAAASQAGRLADVQREDAASSLPAGAESLRALEARERFESGGQTSAVVVVRRAGGLTAADSARLAETRRRLAGVRDVATPLPPPRFSRDGAAALLVVPLRDLDDPERLNAAVDALRDAVDAVPAGVEAAVTGPAAFEADISAVFEGADVSLLLGTALLVLVLLVAIYRSPVFWLIPFATVLLAEGAVRGLTVGLAEAGVVVSPQTAGITSVLVFGAGTDYALLLVSRYREELRRHEDAHEAMRRSLLTAGPAVVASGLTVALALLVLVTADLGSTSGLGPVAAMGVTVAMLATLTILPALLLIAGRRAFWPFVPRVSAHGDPATRGPWRRVGERVARRPRPVWLAGSALLVLLALGVVRLDTTLAPADLFRERVEAVEGQELVATAFPAGSSATATVFVPGAARGRALEVGRRLVAGSEQVEAIAGVEVGEPGALLEVTTTRNPFAAEAIEAVPALRRDAVAAGGPGTLVGGQTAEQYDARQAARRDNVVVVPVALAVVLLVLVVLLRSLVAPLLLVATVVLSFGAALGAGALLFEPLLGTEGSDPSLPLIAFVFLVALGVDYNIFLMSRVREETLVRGTREGMLRGLAATGTVITSAGVVLAGTFSILAALPIVVLIQLGLVIALGVLIDTFFVRSVLVPALAFDVDRRIWWPSGLSRPEPRLEAGGSRAEAA